ncbi:hypothetical protein [Lentzea cavernae]|uniref:Uncharacterized protein n=1 Tax=Lentzea cavernae TaxID=2020703 RepID=A0ABQ3MA84_9PSEU|nr:hypothetical protein [Lentzea cavernae]GHH37638.1 hypothetical protein GCM10017774_26680 [Lentzea cavernae]
MGEIVDRITALAAEHAPAGWAEIRIDCDALAGCQLTGRSRRRRSVPVRVQDRYSVFWQHDGQRRFYAEFDGPGDAVTYLISYHNALRQPV